MAAQVQSGGGGVHSKPVVRVSKTQNEKEVSRKIQQKPKVEVLYTVEMDDQRFSIARTYDRTHPASVVDPHTNYSSRG